MSVSREQVPSKRAAPNHRRGERVVNRYRALSCRRSIEQHYGETNDRDRYTACRCHYQSVGANRSRFVLWIKDGVRFQQSEPIFDLEV
jgi:hypothetical protein